MGNNYHDFLILIGKKTDEIRVEDQLMIYLQKSMFFMQKGEKILRKNRLRRNQGGGSAHDLFAKKYVFMQMGILFNTFCFYPDLQQLHS